MLKTREEQFKIKFEATYGEGQWPSFVKLVNATVPVRPSAIQEAFISRKSGNKMSKSSFYMWEARAQE